MKRLPLIMLLGFVIAFVAGLEVGVSHRPVATITPTAPAQPTTRPDDALPHLRERLNLTSDQEKKMAQIWHDARKKADALSPQFRTIGADRDKALLALFTPEQRSQYEQIQHERETRTTELREKIDKIMHDAAASTLDILTPEQRPKFEEITRQGRRYGPPPMMGGGPPFRHHRPGPETAPLRPETMPSH